MKGYALSPFLTNTPDEWGLVQRAAADENLSYRAVGLLTQIVLSGGRHSPSSDALAASHTEGRDAVRTALQELVTRRYLLRSGVYFVLFAPDSQAQNFAPDSQAQPGNPAQNATDFQAQNPAKPSRTRARLNIQALKTESQKLEKHHVEDAPATPLHVADEIGNAAQTEPGTLEIAKPPADPRDDVERLCVHLADAIEGNGSRRPSITKTWRDAARLLMDKDGRTELQAHTAIDWCQSHEFWKANILSMPKLREKYDQLRLQAQREAAPQRRSTTNERVKQGLELVEYFSKIDADMANSTARKGIRS